MYHHQSENQIVDLYSMSDSAEKKTVPFVHTIALNLRTFQIRTLLEVFQAIHDYKADVLWLPPRSIGDTWKSLSNQFLTVSADTGELIGLTMDIKQRTNFRGGQCASPRQVHSPLESIPEEQVDQLEMQEPRAWFNRRQRRRQTAERRAALLVQEEIGSAAIEVVEDEVPKEVACDVTRGKELNPLLRQVSHLEDTKPLDQQMQFVPVHTHPLTSAGVPRKTAEERMAWWEAQKKTAKRSFKKFRVREAKREQKRASERVAAAGDESSPTMEVPLHMPANSVVPDFHPQFSSSANAHTHGDENWEACTIIVNQNRLLVIDIQNSVYGSRQPLDGFLPFRMVISPSWGALFSKNVLLAIAPPSGSYTQYFSKIMLNYRFRPSQIIR
ncbi:hypothetical protein B0H11DRAFT_1909912 [Mycena galericulata]|nr:hypothetical protein B0H11DRAFT_1909912 [Mycena galericulata]